MGGGMLRPGIQGREPPAREAARGALGPPLIGICRWGGTSSWDILGPWVGSQGNWNCRLSWTHLGCGTWGVLGAGPGTGEPGAPASCTLALHSRGMHGDAAAITQHVCTPAVRSLYPLLDPHAVPLAGPWLSLALPLHRYHRGERVKAGMGGAVGLP